MIRVRTITTHVGPLIAKEDEDKGYTEIVDPITLKPIARLNKVDRKDLLKALRKMGSMLRMKKSLELMGVELFEQAEMLQKGIPDDEADIATAVDSADLDSEPMPAKLSAKATKEAPRKKKLRSKK
jgi:hypothetical protein